MSENRRSASGEYSGKAAQIYRLNGMSPDELIDEMVDRWDAMGEEDYDPNLIDAYLTELDKADPVVPDFDVEVSLSKFREKHAQLFQQTDPANNSSEVMPSTATTTTTRRRWRPIRLLVAVVAVMLGSMIFAQALGFDIFGAIAQWTRDNFHFDSAAQIESSQASIGPANMEYASLQDALDAYGIQDKLAPSWYPPEFKITELKVFHVLNSVQFYESGELNKRFLSITIYQFKSEEDIENVTLEKDSSLVVQYKYGGIVHYLMSNNGEMTATWFNRNFMCLISGGLSEEELKHMIDSIYER